MSTKNKHRNTRPAATRKRKKQRLYVTASIIAILLIIAYFLLSWPVGKTSKEVYIWVDQDDTKDSVFNKLEPVVSTTSLKTMKFLFNMTNYGDHIRTGRYKVGKEGAFNTFRHIKNGVQAPLMLTIPSVRTIDRLAEEVGKRMMFSSEELLDSLQDESVCKRYGFTKESFPCMFIPNTYDLYWNASISSFLNRMKKEYDRFWTPARREKAKTIGLSPEEVTTLASIVEEETANDGEKPMVAGMYINRLNIDMLLQADPTVKFALKDFEAKRIYNSMLSTDSPYNTYKYKGLPPGPIRIPSTVGIDAVLNYTHHDYLYMCAKEDFSGTHNFAKTYTEHQANAAKYVKALNERGIK